MLLNMESVDPPLVFGDTFEDGSRGKGIPERGRGGGVVEGVT